MSTDMNTTVDDLNLTEQGAFSLSQAAVMLDQARSDKGKLATALEGNLEVWVALRTLVSQGGKMPAETRDNLTRLSNFVADATMKHGVDMPQETLDTLININLQISEGILEGAGK